MNKLLLIVFSMFIFSSAFADATRLRLKVTKISLPTNEIIGEDDFLNPLNFDDISYLSDDKVEIFYKIAFGDDYFASIVYPGRLKTDVMKLKFNSFVLLTNSYNIPAEYTKEGVLRLRIKVADEDFIFNDKFIETDITISVEEVLASPNKKYSQRIYGLGDSYIDYEIEQY